MKERLQYTILIDSTERYKKSVSLIKQENGEDLVIQKSLGDIDIVSEIKKILKDNKVSIEEVLEFRSNPGPGSFTGIKIGLTISNTLNWALGKKEINDLQSPEYGKEPNIQGKNIV